MCDGYSRGTDGCVEGRFSEESLGNSAFGEKSLPSMLSRLRAIACFHVRPPIERSRRRLELNAGRVAARLLFGNRASSFDF